MDALIQFVKVLMLLGLFGVAVCVAAFLVLCYEWIRAKADR